jgi:hypothetical protein
MVSSFCILQWDCDSLNFHKINLHFFKFYLMKLSTAKIYSVSDRRTNEWLCSIGGIHWWNTADSSELTYFDKTLFQ